MVSLACKYVIRFGAALPIASIPTPRLHLAYNLIAYAATVVGFWAVRRARLGMAR